MTEIGVYNHIICVLSNTEGNAITNQSQMVHHIKEVVKLAGIGNVSIDVTLPKVDIYQYNINQSMNPLDFAVHIYDIDLLKWLLKLENASNYIDSALDRYVTDVLMLPRLNLKVVKDDSNCDMLRLLLKYASGTEMYFRTFCRVLESVNSLKVIKCFIDAKLIDIMQSCKTVFGTKIPIQIAIERKNFEITKMLIHSSDDITKPLYNVSKENALFSMRMYRKSKRREISSMMDRMDENRALKIEESDKQYDAVIESMKKFIPDYISIIEYLDKIYSSKESQYKRGEIEFNSFSYQEQNTYSSTKSVHAHIGILESVFTPEQYQELRALLISKGEKERYSEGKYLKSGKAPQWGAFFYLIIFPISPLNSYTPLQK